VADLRLTAHSLLNGWSGDAANAYKKQMSLMESFCKTQETNLLQALHALSTIYALGVATRRSYHNLCLATIAAARHEIEEQADRDTKFEIAILGDLAKGILAMNTETLLTGGITASIDIGTHVHEYVAESGEDAVIDGYMRQATALHDGLQEGLWAVRDRLRTQASQVSGSDVPLFEPLPSHCDIDSPDFRYENFKLGDHDRSTVGKISPTVTTEREKYQQEKTGSGGPISSDSTATRERYDHHYRPMGSPLGGSDGCLCLRIGVRRRNHTASVDFTNDDVADYHKRAADHPTTYRAIPGCLVLPRPGLRFVHSGTGHRERF
jgi:hypothetical protein